MADNYFELLKRIWDKMQSVSHFLVIPKKYFKLFFPNRPRFVKLCVQNANVYVRLIHTLYLKFPTTTKLLNQSQTLWNTLYEAYFNAISYLSRCDQSDLVSYTQKKRNFTIFVNVRMFKTTLHNWCFLCGMV